MADIRLDRRFSKTVRARYENYEFDVGVLQDGPHKSALSSARGLKSVAGGPARKTGRSSYQSIAAVSESLREKTGINFYTEPFRAKKNQDILKFTRAFLSHAGGKPRLNQVKNLLQAIVRNPITRG